MKRRDSLKIIGGAAALGIGLKGNAAAEVRGNAADLIGTLNGRTAIVCGTAPEVFDEFQEAFRRLKDDDPVVFAVSDVGMFLRPLHHWVTSWAQNLPGWIAGRKIRAHGGMNDPDVQLHFYVRRGWTLPGGSTVDYVWDKIEPNQTNTGVAGVQIAHLMGAERIVLCGIPLRGSRKFFEASSNHDWSVGQWGMVAIPELKPKVRSMSGWTREYFGGL